MLSKKFIFNTDFFFDKILTFKQKDVTDIISDKNKDYSIMFIPKKSGSRKLHCLNDDSLLRQLQDKLRINFLNHIPLPDYVYGFVKGSSYKDYLIPHLNNQFYLRIDIQDFFDSISKELVISVFDNYFKISEDDKQQILKLFYEIISLNNKIPQGAITSPSVSNIVFRQLDLRINQYCKKFNIVYTRYADDLLFSSNNKYLHNPFFIKKIARILYSKGFKLNNKKIRKGKESISLNGFVVGKEITLSRRRLYDINKVIFIAEASSNIPIDQLIQKLNSEPLYYRKKHDNLYFRRKSDLINYFGGYRSFLLNWVNRDSDNSKIQKLLERIEKIMITLD
ncbi:reverse transcriptase family protein [Brevibacillus fortis]|uniref:reverse transcriptase family protein n=1 Tax=Brevibacillus fortis TaxID=2126352 RepID=UPI0038FC0B3F